MLAIRGLSVRYGHSAPALRAVDLSVGRRQITAVVGSNGAGKTTVMRAISGALGFHGGRVVDGSVLLDGEPIQQLSPAAVVRRGIAHVPEGRRVFTDLTVEDNLRAGAATQRGGVATLLDDAYEMFDILARRKNQRAGLLSGGEQQMLAIARGLMSKPVLLLLDEPSLGLAPKVVAQIGQIIGSIRDRGTSVLVVEQNAAMALAVADTGFVLAQGRVGLAGTAVELRATEEIQRMYLGGSAAEDPVDLGDVLRPLARWSA